MYDTEFISHSKENSAYDIQYINCILFENIIKVNAFITQVRAHMNGLHASERCIHLCIAYICVCVHVVAGRGYRSI